MNNIDSILKCLDDKTISNLDRVTAATYAKGIPSALWEEFSVWCACMLVSPRLDQNIIEAFNFVKNTYPSKGFPALKSKNRFDTLIEIALTKTDPLQNSAALSFAWLLARLHDVTITARLVLFDSHKAAIFSSHLAKDWQVTRLKFLLKRHNERIA